MASESVVYADFSGGEYGNLGGRKAPNGTWTGRNMRLYRNGSLGVRPGVRDLAITGLTSGTIWGLAYAPFTDEELFIVIGTGVRLAPFAVAGASASSGTLAATPGAIIRVSESTRRLDSKLWFINPGDKAYYCTPSANTITAITDSPAGQTLELYKDRLIGAGTNERLRYSNVADFDGWSTLQFIDVGYEYPAYHIVSHRDGVSIFAQALIWRITGTVGSTEVLRRASSKYAAYTGDAVADGDQVFYVPNARNAPVMWDGSTEHDRPLAHLEWRTAAAGAGNISGGIARRYSDILFVENTNDEVLWRSSGAWTYHTFGFSQAGVMTRAGTDKFVIASDASTPKLYVLDASLDRPGFTDDTYARPGDDSTTLLSGNFTLPEHWDPQDRQLMVRAVTVNYTKWNTGSATDNAFTVTVTSLDKFNGGAAAASTSQSFAEAGSAASVSGTDAQATFYFGDQGVGGGFKIALTAIKGVAIRDIVATVDIHPSRSR